MFENPLNFALWGNSEYGIISSTFVALLKIKIRPERTKTKIFTISTNFAPSPNLVKLALPS